MSEEAGADAILKPPGFVSSKLDLIINEGETIRLPCIVTRYQMTAFSLCIDDNSLWAKTDEVIMMKHFSQFL